jgi:hypothetical protein
MAVLLPWWCSVVLCAFVWVGCTLRRVMYYCCFFLYDMAVLLPLILKKIGGAGALLEAIERRGSVLVLSLCSSLYYYSRRQERSERKRIG